jgi:cytochrome b
MNRALRAVRVWDLPTRMFHWLLAACVVGSVVSAKVGGNAMVWHFRLGYVVFALLAFRILWGLMGGRWSRFGSFLYAPATVLRYLRRDVRAAEHLDVGHNPLGALSVFGLLAFLAAQVGTGLFADDEISNAGPLVKFVSGATSHLLSEWHEEVGQFVIIAMVVLHVGAIAFYWFRKKQNLVGPMLSGDKWLEADVPASADGMVQRGLAVVLMGLCAALVYWVVGLGD